MFQIPSFNPFPGAGANAPSISYGMLDPMVDAGANELLRIPAGGFYIQQIYTTDMRAIKEARLWFKRTNSRIFGAPFRPDAGDWVLEDGGIETGVGHPLDSSVAPVRSFYIEKNAAGEFVELWVRISRMEHGWLSLGRNHATAAFTFSTGKPFSWSVEDQAGNIPPVSITHKQHFKPNRISADAVNNAINIAAAPSAQRCSDATFERFPVWTSWSGDWRTMDHPLNTLVHDNTSGKMFSDDFAHGLVIPLAGWWMISVGAGFLSPDSNPSIGLAFAVNESVQRGTPFLFSGSTHVSNTRYVRLVVSDRISISVLNNSPALVYCDFAEITAIWMAA